MGAINPANKQRQQAIDNAIQDRASAKFERRIRLELAKTMREAATEYERRGEIGIALAVRDHTIALENALETQYRTVGRMFGMRLLDEAKSYRGPVVVKRETLETFNLFLEGFIEDWTATRITQINRTTETQIRSLIRSGLEEGLGIDKISKQIREQADSISRVRANVIARTETHSAAGFGAQQAAESTGLELEKEWVAAADERTREDHQEVDGTRIGMKEAFTVGDSEMMFPGDPAGSAEQVINCRCSVAYWSE
jgi:SPP1 gp7 family putative phage head morphogenesis protein